MQEVLEDEVKPSVGKEASPAFPLCLEGFPDLFPICGKPRTQHFIKPKCCKDLGHGIGFSDDAGGVVRGKEPRWLVHTILGTWFSELIRVHLLPAGTWDGDSVGEAGDRGFMPYSL